MVLPFAQSQRIRLVVLEWQVSSTAEQRPLMLQPGRLLADTYWLQDYVEPNRSSLGQDADEGSLCKSVVKWRRWRHLACNVGPW